MAGIIAGTGHRPEKLGGYGWDVYAKLVNFAAKELARVQPTILISGMACGWDMALAEAALLEHVPYLAAVPFQGQETRWSHLLRKKYERLLAGAKEVTVVSPGGYAAWKMHVRNHWMVERCESVLALWDGSVSGTGECVAYAGVIKKPVDNVWERWVDAAGPFGSVR